MNCSELVNSKANKILDLFFIVIILVFSFCSGFLLWESQKSFDGISDAPEYAVVGRMLLEGSGTKVYDIDELVNQRHRLFPTLRERTLAILSPPPGIVLFIPFGLVDSSILRNFYLSFCVLFSFVSLWLIGRSFSLNKHGWLFLFAFATMYWPLFTSLRIGQLTSILFLSLSVSYYLFSQNLPYVGILVLSIFAAKPQYLLPFVFYLLGARKYKYLIVGTAIMLSLVLVSFVFVGFEGYKKYLEILLNLNQYRTVLVPEISPTIAGQLSRFPNLPNALVMAINYFGLFSTFIFSFLLGRKLKPETTNQNLFMIWMIIILPISLLTAALCHAYDFVLLIPSVLALRFGSIIPTLDKKTQNFAAMLLYVFIFLLSIPIALQLHMDYVLTGTGVNPFFVILLVYSLFWAWAGWRWVTVNGK